MSSNIKAFLSITNYKQMLLAIILLTILGLNSAKVVYTGPVFGINLGFSHSSIGIIRKNDKFEVVPDSLGNTLIPSYVAYTDDGKLFGHEAREYAKNDPKNVVYNVGKLLVSENVEERLEELGELEYDVTLIDGKPYVKLESKGKPMVL